jgi:high-affinity nickel permease
VSLATLVVTVLMLIFQSFSWVSMAIIMAAMAWFLGLRHPVVVDESEPLDPARKAIAFAALVIFVLCFTPVPIQTFFK